MSKSEIEIKKSTKASELLPDTWRNFRSEMDRLLSRFDGGLSIPSMHRLFGAMPAWRDEAFFGANAPVVDVSEDEKSYKVTAELPGLDEKHIAVSLTNHCLVIKGEKRQEKEEKDKNHYLSERVYGSFERSFTLPESIDEDKVEAHFSKGVLTISLPKTADAQKQKRIDIKAA